MENSSFCTIDQLYGAITATHGVARCLQDSAGDVVEHDGIGIDADR